MEISHNLIAYVLASGFLFFFGATIGSFLNVVIYRLPAGLNLMKPASRCPVCEHPIRARDNVPVLGWLALGGKCRDCGVNIPIRYPLVELVVGLLFLGLGHWELLTGGANLPPASAPSFPVDPLFWYASWPMTAIYAFHCVLLCCLLAASLIRYDGHEIPRRLSQVTLLIGLLPAVFAPALRPLPFDVPWLLPFDTGVFTGAIDGLAGLLVGNVAGLLLTWRAESSTRHEGVFVFSAAGVYFGWQAAFSLAVLSSLVCLPLFLRGTKTPSAFVIAVSTLTLLHMVVWKRLWSVPYWPGATSAAWVYVVGGIFLFACGQVGHYAAADVAGSPASDSPPLSYKNLPK